MERKQQLLRRHRRTKQVFLAGVLVALVLLGHILSWWLLPLILVLAWVAHEAWFADHLFYSPRSDYSYRFPSSTLTHDVVLEGGVLHLPDSLQAGQTLILELRLRATWLGHWLDPEVRIGDDAQHFERGVRGRRYLNLTGFDSEGTPLTLSGRHCRLSHSARLHVFEHPDYSQKRLMILAPHADDAELAAFGLYSRCPDVSIVTLTQGEIEAEHFCRLGLDRQHAARLKGRLRSWDSQAIPLWGNVPQQRCVQLGYFCMQLAGMAAAPSQAFASRESGQADIREARRHNALPLPGDRDGQPTWTNLVADLVALLEHFRPEVVVAPHPQLDPHPDHIAASRALQTAIGQSSWKPEVALLYSNHLADNDRWPMGPAGAGIALPPAFGGQPSSSPWSPLLGAEAQLHKAMALAMQHDLQTPLKLKGKVRRWIQAALVGRRWPRAGEDEFFRKAVRRHELFWVQCLRSPANPDEPQPLQPQGD